MDEVMKEILDICIGRTLKGLESYTISGRSATLTVSNEQGEIAITIKSNIGL